MFGLQTNLYTLIINQYNTAKKDANFNRMRSLLFYLKRPRLQQSQSYFSLQFASISIIVYTSNQIIQINPMANVHGFGDIGAGGNRRLPPNRQPNNNNPDEGDMNFLGGFNEPVLEEQLRIAEQHRILFVSGRKSVKNPHDQTYWDMLTYALCPTFKFLSLTFIVCLADIGFFIFLVSTGLDRSSSNLLEVKARTLIDYGANYQPNVLGGQVYRLVSAIFMHIYFMHIFGNVITTFMFLSRIEYTYGTIRTLFAYLIAGICGNIFSLLCAPGGVKAGASTSLFGIIGIIIGYIIINWNGLDLIGQSMKCQIWCTALLIIVFIFIFTPSSSEGIDYYGHLGGFLAGVWLSAIQESIISERRQKVIRGCFIGLLLAQLLISFLVFYLTQTPVSQ